MFMEYAALPTDPHFWQAKNDANGKNPGKRKLSEKSSSGFSTPPSMFPLPDGKRWVLLEEYNYDVGHELSGDRVTVPAWFITDLTSIPYVFGFLLQKWGIYGFAAVIHDYLYWEQTRTRKESDKIFFEGMTVLNVAAYKKWPIYLGVRLFGWRAWMTNKRKKSTEPQQKFWVAEEKPNLIDDYERIV